MTDIELLDQAIEITSKDLMSQDKKSQEQYFCEKTFIKWSTLRSWRSRGSVPDDKKVLLNTIVEKYELEQENLIACKEDRFSIHDEQRIIAWFYMPSVQFYVPFRDQSLDEGNHR